MMWRPQLGMVGYYWPIPHDWPWGENDPRYEREKLLVDALDLDRKHTERSLPLNPTYKDFVIWRARN